MDERNTQDVYFILSQSDLDGVPEIAVRDENRDPVRGDFSGLQIVSDIQRRIPRFQRSRSRLSEWVVRFELHKSDRIYLHRSQLLTGV